MPEEKRYITSEDYREQMEGSYVVLPSGLIEWVLSDTDLKDLAYACDLWVEHMADSADDDESKRFESLIMRIDFLINHAKPKAEPTCGFCGESPCECVEKGDYENGYVD